MIVHTGLLIGARCFDTSVLYADDMAAFVVLSHGCHSNNFKLPVHVAYF